MNDEAQENDNLSYSSISETSSKYNIIEESEIQSQTFLPSNYCCICGDASSPLLHCKCEYEYCKSCLKSYFSLKIAQFDCYHVKCPNQSCTKPVLKLAKAVLPESDYKKFKKFRKTLKHLSDPQLAFCQKPDCEGVSFKNKKYFHCNLCKYEFVETFDPNRAEIIQKMSVIVCPICDMMIERKFACQEVRCACGFEFCGKCGLEIDDFHSNWRCALANRSGRVSGLFIALLMYFPILFPLSPFFVIFGYHRNWDRNYFRVIDEHPVFYPMLLFIFSPVIFIFSLFLLPLVFAGVCVQSLFNHHNDSWLLVPKIILYFPSILLVFLGLLILFALIICLSPVLGVVLFICKLKNPKNF